MDSPSYRSILTATIVCLFVLTSVRPAAGQAESSGLQVVQGTATVQVGDQSQELSAPAGRAVEPGMTVTTASDSAVVVTVFEGCSVTVEADSSVKIGEVTAPRTGKAGKVSIEVLKGSITTEAPAQMEGRLTSAGEKQPPRVDFEIKVGDATARGTNVDARVVKLGKRAYRVQVIRGNMTLRENLLLVKLSEKQRITRQDGDTIDLKAGLTSKGAVTAAYKGFAVLQLDAGQTVRLDPMELAVHVQNLGKDTIRACNWDGTSRNIGGGAGKFYMLMESDIPDNVALSHMSDVAPKIAKVPEVAAPAVARPEYVRPVILPRTDRISASD